MRRCPHRGLSPLLAALALAGCGSEDATPVDTGPSGPPSIRFTNPPSGQGPQCIPIGDDPSAALPLLVHTDELVLRPPGTCGAYLQCGHLALYVGEALNNEGASSAIELLLHKLADPYHDGSLHSGTGEPDLLALRVAVVDDERSELLDHDGNPLSDELGLITAASCDASR